MIVDYKFHIHVFTLNAEAHQCYNTYMYNKSYGKRHVNIEQK